jgi:hypothetical protein
VPMRHELHARRYLDPDHVRSGLRGLSNKHGQSGRRRERRERLPVDVFRQNRSENGFAWLVVSNLQISRTCQSTRSFGRRPPMLQENDST